MDTHLEDRVAALAARVGALELLTETLIARQLATSVRFREVIDDMAAPDALEKDMHLVDDEIIRAGLRLIQSNLVGRVQGARQQRREFARRRHPG